ncbi:LacI family DNA-binding transcriptional regulator [Rubellimicrobium thermophilum]|uniref:LacI family DNA-binding transcriptional regulator n=1 Tax=Rubellimicrobium thermophilum TaxID=295419 RepID=UPI001B7FDB0A|nr:LacI family DNA-binding transcriptional regulator [Rubellimicrobium thermophilum]
MTIRTVAADAGVSVAAVSKVMRNAYGVSEALRQKVEASIEKLGYRPSIAARGMRGQTYTFGVLLVDIENPFLPSIYHGIEDRAEAQGYKVMGRCGPGA